MSNLTAVVAVDGPAGSGKSTICHEVSKKLGWAYLSTGLIYRSLAQVAKMRDISVKDNKKLVEIAHDFSDHLNWNSENSQIFYKDNELTPYLSEMEVAEGASALAVFPEVREALLSIQRKLALQSKSGVIVDGRDIATVVFPDAELKLFITASLEKRSQRRFAQLEEHSDGVLPKLEEIMEQIKNRDHRDGNRSVAPMKMTKDSVVVDTSDMNLDDSIMYVYDLIYSKFFS